MKRKILISGVIVLCLSVFVYLYLFHDTDKYAFLQEDCLKRTMFAWGIPNTDNGALVANDIYKKQFALNYYMVRAHINPLFYDYADNALKPLYEQPKSAELLNALYYQETLILLQILNSKLEKAQQ